MNDALLTALAAMGGFFVKSAWDLYLKRREQRESFSRQKRMDFLERQLSQFYWPMYLHLQKNYVIWQYLEDGRTMGNNNVKERVDKHLFRTLVLENHDEMVRVIESCIHLAQADSELDDLLLRLIRHVAIFKALRQVGIDDVEPIWLGEPWPEELLDRIRSRTIELQREFDKKVGRASARPNHCLQSDCLQPSASDHR